MSATKVVTQQGWQCPKCHAVMSPNYPTCFYCKPDVSVSYGGVGDGVWETHMLSGEGGGSSNG